MESPRLPRFRRTAKIGPIQLTERDRQIIRLVHRHRFLRSSHIVALLSGSAQQMRRRLQRLYHHGYLERPSAQIDYYHRGGSRQMAYGLGSKGASLLKREAGVPFLRVSAGARNRSVGRLFLEHALLISDVMVALELSCRASGRVRLLAGEELPLPRALTTKCDPFQWSVTLDGGLRCGLVPDRVFALEYAHKPAGQNRSYFFLEADRATMPVVRKGLRQSSFFRKLLSYEATWSQGIHQSRFGFSRFRVVTVTTGAERVQHLLEACRTLRHGQGLFLFTERASLTADSDSLMMPWHTARGAIEKLG